MTRATWLFIAIGLVLRLVVIFPGPLESRVESIMNKADLRNYYWPAQAALRGENPYVLWANAQSADYRADMTPLELAIYVATVAIWNDPRAIQVLFALFDALNIGLLGILLKDTRLRIPFQAFYALGPLTFFNLTLVPEDKTILITLTLLLFIFLTCPRDQSLSLGLIYASPATLGIICAALIASFKWLSVFYLPSLLIFLSKDLFTLGKHVFLFALIIVLAHVGWFPAWTYMYAFRAARIATPLHISPAVLLNAVGAYNPMLLLVLLGVLLASIYALFWLKRIDIFETIALATMIGILWTPDMDPVHLSIVALMFLLVTDWTTRARQMFVWLASAWVALVFVISTHSGFARYGLADLRTITGIYGTTQMILLSYFLFVLVFGFYLNDKFHQRDIGKSILVKR